MESRLDHHAHEFLHEELACVGNPDLADVLTTLTRTAEVLLLLDVCFAEETTRRTHMHSVAVTDIEKTLLQESARAMTNHAITLHLSESKTTITRSALSRLSCQNLRGTS